MLWVLLSRILRLLVRLLRILRRRILLSRIGLHRILRRRILTGIGLTLRRGWILRRGLLSQF